VYGQNISDSNITFDDIEVFYLRAAVKVIITECLDSNEVVFYRGYANKTVFAVYSNIRYIVINQDWVLKNNARIKEIPDKDLLIYPYFGSNLRSICSGSSEPFEMASKNYLYRHKRKLYVYQNYEWAEVSRITTLCMAGRLKNRAYDEGYGKGFPADRHDWSKLCPECIVGLPTDGNIPYGCWFNLAIGTGVFVNVGKTLIARSRAEVFHGVGLPYNSQTQGSDKLWCFGALKRGFDSIQVLTKLPFLIICSGNCSKYPLNTTCPLLEMRTGVHASIPCNCNDSMPILNCGTNISPLESCFKRKPLETFQVSNITIDPFIF
jgi:hypothetical protein